jgi:hypothetical protein
MSIKDELLKYFSQLQSGGGSDYGINAKPQGQLGVDSVLGQPTQAGNFGQINPQMQPMGSGGVNQLNTMNDAMSNPIDASKSLQAVTAANAPNKGAADMGKQLIAKSMGSMGGGGGMVAQPQLRMINAQQAFAQMPDATQPQQVQEFQPQQMAQMLRKRYGSV